MLAYQQNLTFTLAALATSSVLLFAHIPASAATCPFDGGASDAVNDGLVLTRYALGITGAPMTASTRYASLDPLQVKNNIECVGCALDMNGDGQIDTVDTTIIARHLAGFSGAALTNGLALGAGSRPNTAAVVSFLANGCAVGGAINAWVLGGNSFGESTAPAQIGTNDNRDLSVTSNGTAASFLVKSGVPLETYPYQGLRVVTGEVQRLADNPATPFIVPWRGVNVFNGHTYGNPRTNIIGATISGGGAVELFQDRVPNRRFGNDVTGSFATVGGGLKNDAAESATVAGGYDNAASGIASAIPGGESNRAAGAWAFAAGNRSLADGDRSVAMGYRAIVRSRQAVGEATSCATNRTCGDEGTFVWSDSSVDANFTSTGPNQFNIRANGGVGINAAPINSNIELTIKGTPASTSAEVFLQQGNTTNEGVVLQATNGTPGNNNVGFYIFQSNGTASPSLAAFTQGSLMIPGTLVQGSDRAIKENFGKVNAKDVLAKVVSLPLAVWNYNADEAKTRHLGPMSQDFKRLFGLGKDDKTIATVDAQGVAFAAIQGLNQKLLEQVKAKDAEIAQLKAKAQTFERELAAIKKRLGM